MKKAISFILAVVLTVFFAACSSNNADKDGDTVIPEEVLTLVEDYMNAYKIGTDKSVEYVHFEMDFIREAYIATNDKLIDYSIESTEKINDNLYGFTILGKTEKTIFHSGDVYNRAYNFVAFIDDSWYFINGVVNIPEIFKENFDETKYIYENVDVVNPKDVIREPLP